MQSAAVPEELSRGENSLCDRLTDTGPGAGALLCASGTLAVALGQGLAGGIAMSIGTELCIATALVYVGKKTTGGPVPVPAPLPTETGGEGLINGNPPPVVTAQPKVIQRSRV